MGFGCLIDASGNVWCWGDDTFGEVGIPPTTSNVATPQQVVGVSGAAALALGDHHACAITTGHAVYCWGLNAAYQLGHPAATQGDEICLGAVAGQTVPCAYTPSLVANLAPAAAIAAAGAWTCILTTGGAVECWGAMQTIQADAGTTSDAGIACGLGTQASGGTCYPAPYTVTGLGGVTQLAVAYDHACAVVASNADTDAGNAVSCWGSNNEGQVSPLACPQSSCETPITRDDLPTTTSLTAGNLFTCALAPDGSVRCFGDNSYGQLGHTPGSSGDFGSASEGGFGVYNPTPVAAAATTVSSLVGGGSESTCALLPSGTVECWGQVSAAGSANPVAITGLPPIDGLGTFDGANVCGLSATDGTVWCWTLGSSSTPTNINPIGADGGDAGDASEGG
jgi:alpha-tubulin suppressor-like RCC1 family protein